MNLAFRFIQSGVLFLLLLQCCRAAPYSFNNTEYVHNVTRLSKASELSSLMNTQMNPCDDFYKFACGNWGRINPAKKDSLKTGLFENLSKGLERKVKIILNSKDAKLDTPEDLQVKNFYKSCLAVHEIDKNYRQKLKEIIAEFGSMPALEGDAWQESQFDWLETIGRISHRYGFNIIVGSEVEINITSNKINTIYIEEQQFSLESRGMYLDKHTSNFRNIYRKSIAHKLTHYLGLSKDESLLTAENIFNFEVELARGLLNESDGLGLMEILNLTTVADMQSSFAPILDVERLLNITFGEQIKGFVYDYNSQYKQNLIRVINETSKSTVANYIFYQLIEPFYMKLGKSQPEREEKCVQNTREHFSKNLDNMIFRRFNDNKTASDIEIMWHELKSNFKQTLESDESLDWISRQTRAFAIEKLDAMNLQINSYVGENLAEDFDDLQLQSEDYIENLRQIYILSTRQALEKLHNPAESFELGEVLSFTPANILVENIIKVPVALLQPNYLWSAHYPNAIKFGTLASLIGHELIHGFDDTGRTYDKLGNSNDWWDEESAANFVQRQKCFTEQYGNYSYNGRQLQRKKAQSENIADNGGVRLAYATYLRWLKAQEDSVEGRKQLMQERLPTLNYTPKQLFFISFAQIWCNDVLEIVRDVLISTDDHVPGELRVIGVLSNLDEFSKEFQCETGTPMNPTKNCKIY